MKLRYDAASDMLYVDVAPRPSEESEEVAPGIVLDFDADGEVVGIEVEHASSRFDLREMEADVDGQRLAAFRFVDRARVSRR